LGLFSSIVTLGTYTGGQSLISEETIFRALEACIDQHPALGTILQDVDTEQPLLARAETMDLSKHFTELREDSLATSREASLNRILEQVHNTRLDDCHLRPQWRVYIMHLSLSPRPRFCLAFTSSHVLSDGISGLIFHSTFLEALQHGNFQGSHEGPILKPRHKMNLLPALDMAGEFSVSSSKHPSLLPTPTQETWIGTQIRPAPPSSDELLQTKVHIVYLAESTLSRLLRVCKSRRGRLTGLINHLTARAVSRALRERNQHFNTFLTETPVNMRPALARGQNGMANYASVVLESITVDPTCKCMTDEDWSNVEKSTQLLGKAAGTLVDQPVALLKHTSNFRTSLKTSAAQPATASFGVSNVGVFDGGSDENAGVYRVEDMVFSLGAGIGTAFDVWVVSVKHGSLSMVVTWWSGMLGVEDERVFVEEICADLLREMEEISEQ
jgi:hypothetical protein